MADTQEYFEQWETFEETQYGTSSFPLTALGVQAWNKSTKVKALPIEGSETANTGTQIAFQRLKRIKGEATVQAAATGAGSNFTARLNKAQKLTWVTKHTKAINKMDVIIHFAEDQDMDLGTGSYHMEQLSKEGIGTLYDIEEKALVSVVAKAKGTGTAGAPVKLSYDRTLAKAQVIADTLDAAVEATMMKSDDFVHFTDASDVVVLVHPVLSGAFAKLEGQGYQLGTNTFPEGIGKSFRYNGIDYIVDEAFNSIPGVAATEVLGALVMTRDSYMNAGASFLAKHYEQKLLDETVAGHSYGEIDMVMDEERITKFELTLAGTGLAVSKKVNA